eukprot:gene8151-11036_t
MAGCIADRARRHAAVAAAMPLAVVECGCWQRIGFAGRRDDQLASRRQHRYARQRAAELQAVVARPLLASRGRSGA